MMMPPREAMRFVGFLLMMLAAIVAAVFTAFRIADRFWPQRTAESDDPAIGDIEDFFH